MLRAGFPVPVSSVDIFAALLCGFNQFANGRKVWLAYSVVTCEHQAICEQDRIKRTRFRSQ